MPPESAATIGTPLAIASNMISGIGSRSDGQTNTSSDRNNSGMSSLWEINVMFDSSFNDFQVCITVSWYAFSGLITSTLCRPPTTTKCRSGFFFSINAAAFRNVKCPFQVSHRAIIPMSIFPG